jgi:hypothetical protein
MHIMSNKKLQTQSAKQIDRMCCHIPIHKIKVMLDKVQGH